MTLNEKYEKAQIRLAALMEQKGTLDNKIEKVKNEISQYENIIKNKQFNELEDVLRSNGMNFNEILELARAGDLNILKKELGQAREREEYE